MLSTLKKLLNSGVEIMLADHTIPISEEVINAALAIFAEGIPEITSLGLDIQDGSFELLAEGKKVLTLKLCTRFEITSCEISANKQLITFRRISPTDLSADKLLDRLVIEVFKAVACGIFQIEPAKFILERQPGITVKGDNYTVDLSQTEIAGNAIPKIESVLKATGLLMKVKHLRCVPNTLQVLIGRN